MNVNLKEFPKGLHKRLKVRAAQEEVTMKALIFRVLEEYMDRVDKRKRKR